MPTTRRLTVILLLTLVGWPAGADAQPANPLTAAVRANVAPSEAGTSAMVGASLTYALTERLAVEAEAVYFSTSHLASTWGLALDALVAVGRDGWSGHAVPYAVAGIGFERATIRLSGSRLLGAIPPGVSPGSRFGPTSGPAGPRHGGAGPLPGCPAEPGVPPWGVGDLPDFYARRLGVLVVPEDGRWPTRRFTDPVVTLGGGVRVGGTGGLFLQPEARLWLALSGDDADATGLFGLTVGYRF